MRDLETAEYNHVMGDIEPAGALEACIGLVEAGILIVDRGLRIELQIDAVALPQRIGPQTRFDRRGNVRILLRV